MNRAYRRGTHHYLNVPNANDPYLNDYDAAGGETEPVTGFRYNRRESIDEMNDYKRRAEHVTPRFYHESRRHSMFH